MNIIPAFMGATAAIVIADVFDIVADTAANLDTAGVADWDLIVAKSRVNTTDWVWRDTLNGVSTYLASNSTAQQAAFSDYATLLGSGNAIQYRFKEADNFFALRSFSHTNGVASNVDLSSLGTVGLVYVKALNATSDWWMWHRSLTAGNNMRLNTNAAETTTDAYISVSGTTMTFASGAPTAAYGVMAWAHNPGFVWCDAYTGNGTTPGPTVSLGAQPGFLQIKQRTVANQAVWHDEERGFPPAGNSPWLNPAGQAADIASIPSVEVNSGGFDIVTANGTWNGEVTNGMIYTAFPSLL